MNDEKRTIAHIPMQIVMGLANDEQTIFNSIDNNEKQNGCNINKNSPHKESRNQRIKESRNQTIQVITLIKKNINLNILKRLNTNL